MSIRHFIISIDMPTSVSDAEIREHIHTAVRGWGGGGHPDDPFFGLDKDSIKVRKYHPSAPGPRGEMNDREE